jgi:hypothetical protein
VGTPFDGQWDHRSCYKLTGRNLDNWPLFPSPTLNLRYIWFSEAVVNENKHNLVQFADDLAKMRFRDNPRSKEIVLFPHDTLAPALPYLPWMQNTITFMRIHEVNNEAFTAQLSGCGVRVFRMYGSTYLSHDNAITISTGCPDDNTFRQRFKDASFIHNLNDLQIIASVRPGIDVNIDSNFGVYQTNEPKLSPETNYVLRAAVSAIWNGDDGWCLAIQRSVQVYEGSAYPGNQILVPRKVNGRPGYQLICETKNNLVHFDTDRYEHIYYKIIADRHGSRLAAFGFDTITNIRKQIKKR